MNTIKILLLEDEISLGKSYEKRLTKEGFQIKWVQNSQEFKKQLLQEPVDIIILDHGLKQDTHSGIELIPLVKKYAPNSQCIILSNYSQFQLEQEVLQAGADSYLLKINYSPKKLAEYLRNL